MKLTADALNHLLRQNPWATERLRPFAGKTLRLHLPPLRTSLTLDASGECLPAAPDSPVDAEIHVPFGAALRMLADPDSAMNLATLQGDMDLATTFGKVLQQMRWDAEEDLSRIVGDIPAHQLTQTGARIRQELSRQALSLAGMLSEYWLEESPLIAKRTHLERFSGEVDALREDVERLEKRLARLEQSRPCD